MFIMRIAGRHVIAFLCLLALSHGIFCIQQRTPSGCLVIPYALSAQMHSDPNNMLQSKFEAEKPHCYQMLFRVIFNKIVTLDPHYQTLKGYFSLYIAAHTLCLAMAAYAFLLLQRQLGAGFMPALAGSVAFLSAYPCLFSHQFPVNSRGSDFLSYFFISLILISILRDRPGWVIVLAFLGALSKENALLAVVPFFFVTGRSWAVRLGVLAACVAGVLYPRIHYGFMEPGSLRFYFLEGLKANFSQPLETAFFSLLTFGAFWIFALLNLTRSDFSSHNRIFGRKLTLFLLGLMLVTYVLTGAYFKENRILFIAFPWIFFHAFEYLKSPALRQIFRTRSFRLTLLVMTLGWTPLFLIKTYVNPEFVNRIKILVGPLFEPGFQCGKICALVKVNGSYNIHYEYLSSPWGGLYFSLHLSWLVAVVIGTIVRRNKERHRPSC